MHVNIRVSANVAFHFQPQRSSRSDLRHAKVPRIAAVVRHFIDGLPFADVRKKPLEVVEREVLFFVRHVETLPGLSAPREESLLIGTVRNEQPARTKHTPPFGYDVEQVGIVEVLKQMRGVNPIERVIREEWELPSIAPELLTIFPDLRVGLGHIERPCVGNDLIKAEAHVHADRFGAIACEEIATGCGFAHSAGP